MFIRANFANNNQKICSFVVNDGQDLVPTKLNYNNQMNSGILSMQIHQYSSESRYNGLYYQVNIYQNDQGNKDSPDSKAFLILPKNRVHCITSIEFLMIKKSI